MDCNFYSSETNVSFLKCYKDQAHYRMIFTVSYLNRIWGDMIINFFFNRDQENIKSTNWDEYNKSILAIISILATMEYETK